MSPFGLTRPRLKLTLITMVKRSTLRIPSQNGGLGICILMPLRRTPGALLPKIGNGKTLKISLLSPSLPNILLLSKKEDSLLPLVPVNS